MPYNVISYFKLYSIKIFCNKIFGHRTKIPVLPSGELECYNL